MKQYYALILLLAVSCSKFNTEYSQPEIPAKFEFVKVGDPVEKVYATLGVPMFIDANLNRSGGTYRQESLGKVNLENVLLACSNTNVELTLIYSQPKTSGKNYILYEVVVREGRVSEKAGPSYQD
jgi:hypothetical protein